MVERTRKTRWALPRGLTVLVALALVGCSSGQGDGRTIVLYGFSVLEDVMVKEIIPAFQEDWREETGEEVQSITSFAGSGTIANQIMFGTPAQVGMVATELDARRIEKAGVASSSWLDLPNQGTFAYTVAVILTRAGNPKGIHGYEDLTRTAISNIYPDPTTSGGAQWAILGLYGSALAESSAEGAPDLARARELLRGVSKNAGSLPESARKAQTQFGLGYGDALAHL